MMTTRRTKAERRGRGGRALLAGGALAGAVALTLSAGAVGRSAPQTDETLQSVRESQRQYIELRSQISLEVQQREQTELFLEEQVALLEGRIARLNEETETLRGTIGETRDSRGELEAKEARLKEGTASLEEAIGALEEKARIVLKRLPAPVREQVVQISRDLMTEAKEPVEGEEAKPEADLYTRYIQVVGAMNMIDKFNTSLKVTTEQIELPGGKSKNVRVVYLGAGQAYYVDNDGTIAGVGVPTEDGFAWSANNDLAPTLSMMMKMYEGGAEAAFLMVPVLND